MITVDDVVKKTKKQNEQISEENEQMLSTGKVIKKRSYLPWILLATGAALGAYLLYKHNKKSGTNSGISG
jgi:heme oxygenase